MRNRHFNRGLFLFFVSLIIIMFCSLPSSFAQGSFRMGVVHDTAHSNPVRKAATAVVKQITDKTSPKIKLISFKNTTTLKEHLKDGQIDLALIAFTKKQNNGRNFRTTQPFFYPANILFRRADGHRNSVEKLADQKVGLLSSANQGPLLRGLQLKSRRYSSIGKIVTALKTKKISAAILTEEKYTTYLQTHPELVQARDHSDSKQTGQILKRINDPLITSQNICGLTYKDSKLVRQINDQLSNLQKTGRLTKISLKYFGKDISQK